MNGDPDKSESGFSRWVEFCGDGLYSIPKGKKKLSNRSSFGNSTNRQAKRFKRRWSRRTAKLGLLERVNEC